MKNNKTIWILGGMWPGASAEMYLKIIRHAQYGYGAVQDHEFPPVIINSLTLRWFDETGVIDPVSVEKELIEWVKTLENSWADLIIIACNTVHVFYQQMQDAIKIPILNIVEHTCMAIKDQGHKKVWLLCSQSTRDLHLYHKHFIKEDIGVINCNEVQQAQVNRVIENVMGNHQWIDDIIILKTIMRDMIEQWAENIILWCTELPLAINQVHTDYELFDTMDILVKKSVENAMK